jgi:hypothetical protein
MKKAFDPIKKAWEENPVQVTIVGALVASVAVKVLTAMTEANNSRTWRKEVDRRSMMIK